MIRISDITEKVQSYIPSPDIDLIHRAYVFSAKVHKGQLRLSGEPYLTHPLEVSAILADLRLDEVTVAVGLLHDTVEDTLATEAEISELFGEEVVFLVNAVTKISQITFASHEEKQAENFRKMLLAMAKDIRVILIKLADRLHNMRTLEYLSREKQIRIAQETMDIYAPFANRLGIAKVKSELEDLALKYLEPEVYAELSRKVTEGVRQRQGIIDEAIKIIQAKLKEYNTEGIVSGRTKHLYSIYQKMKRKGISFDEVFDLMGIRIITNNVRDCYAALGLMHSIWPPLPGEFDDYIAMPKPNMYQSLHTVVIGPGGHPLEIQIRTYDMHRTAEEGIAAHWRYKERDKLDKSYDERFVWLRQLMEWQQDLKDPSEFLHMMKVDLFHDEVFVFTPKGKVMSFPQDATAIDFAYAIHTEVGHHCVGAKVNGRMVPLRYRLKTGDIVEIITSPNHHPSRDWLKIVKTTRAIQRIKRWLKTEEKERCLALGREILDKELAKYGLSYLKLQKKGDLLKVANRFGLVDTDELMVDIAYGKISARQVLSEILPQETLQLKSEPSKLKKVINKITQRKGEGVKIKGVDDVMARFAKCCNPVPGDKIVGFITRGRGVSVHRANCPNVDPFLYGTERLIEATWDVQEDVPYQVEINVRCADKPGMLAKITAAISEASINIITADVKTGRDASARCRFTLEITNLKQLEKVINSIKMIRDVIEVERASSYLSKNKMEPHASPTRIIG
ncbi:MAG: bifunctional (p)ppGpp synthetase/guanosine-3',5'-bis(diphosphate) 3'-pyrophosphohydrolase [bacterium]|nr:bifunctional (p)ppGpp synthetase/guanosine-3',5'-bis(diphosphate) 3'-pyrophosphohydrolase [bacterium]